MQAMEHGERTKRRTMGARTGGRSERVVRDVIRATLEELGRVGYAAMRVEDVATRAGVNKTTVYRRWPTKLDLVTGALQSAAGHRDPAPDTGTVRADLVELARRTMAFARTTEGRIVAKLVSGAATDPDLERLTRALRASSNAQRLSVIERAQARGEIPASVDGFLVAEAIFTPVTMRILRYGEDVDMQWAEALVDVVLSGAVTAATSVTR